RWRMGGLLIALLLLGPGVVAAADDPPAAPEPRSTWHLAPVWQQYFPEPAKPAARPTPPPPARERAEKPKPAPRESTPAEEAATRREREEKAYLRRLAVCLKLHEIAEATHDEELERKACELDERIWAVYSQRTGRPLVGDDSDAQVLQKSASARGQKDSGPAYTVSGKDRANDAAIQEERP